MRKILPLALSASLLCASVLPAQVFPAEELTLQNEEQTEHDEGHEHTDTEKQATIAESVSPDDASEQEESKIEQQADDQAAKDNEGAPAEDAENKETGQETDDGTPAAKNADHGTADETAAEDEDAGQPDQDSDETAENIDLPNVEDEFYWSLAVNIADDEEPEEVSRERANGLRDTVDALYDLYAASETPQINAEQYYQKFLADYPSDEAVAEAFGPHSTQSNLKELVEKFYTASIYGSVLASNLTFSDEELEAVYDADPESYLLYDYATQDLEYDGEDGEHADMAAWAAGLQEKGEIGGDNVTAVSYMPKDSVPKSIRDWITHTDRKAGDAMLAAAPNSSTLTYVRFDGAHKDDRPAVDLYSILIKANDWKTVPTDDEMTGAMERAEQVLQGWEEEKEERIKEKAAEDEADEETEEDASIAYEAGAEEDDPEWPVDDEQEEGEAEVKKDAGADLENAAAAEDASEEETEDETEEAEETEQEYSIEEEMAWFLDYAEKSSDEENHVYLSMARETLPKQTAAWALNEERKTGDTAVFEVNGGYRVFYYAGASETERWEVKARAKAIANKMADIAEADIQDTLTDSPLSGLSIANDDNVVLLYNEEIAMLSPFFLAKHLGEEVRAAGVLNKDGQSVYSGSYLGGLLLQVKPAENGEGLTVEGVDGEELEGEENLGRVQGATQPDSSTGGAGRVQRSGADTAADGAHTHLWVKDSETPATCTANGSITYKCNCGETKTESVQTTGHTWKEVNRVAPGCGTPGSVVYQCQKCGLTRTEPLGATGQHSWVTNTVAATCAKAGYTEVKCSKCGAVQSHTAIPATGDHDWKEISRTEPNCGVDGQVVYQCSKCKQKKTTTLKATGRHYWVEEETPATCTKEGSWIIKCAVCGEVQSEAVLQPTGEHKWIETGRVSATCTQDGSITYTCQSCKETRVETIKATGQHNWVTEQVLTKDAWDEQVLVKDAYDEQVLVKDAYDEQVTVSEAYDEQVVVTEAYDEQVLVKDAWDEQVLVKDAWDEQVLVKEAWDEEVWEQHMVCECGVDFEASGMTQEQINAHLDAHVAAGESYGNVVKPILVNRIHHEAEYTTVHNAAEYQTVHHDAEYQTVHHDATYETIHHDAVYEKVHHEAEYQTVHHDAEYKTVHHPAEYQSITKCTMCGEEKK